MEFLPSYFSKILITGNLNPSIPYIVLKELAFEMGLLVSVERLENDVKYWAKIFKKLTKLEPQKITDYEKDHDLLIQMINPLESKWENENLKNAYIFLNLFIEFLKGNQNDQTFNFSFMKAELQSNKNPCSFNACILYALCKSKNIIIPLNASYQDMESLMIQYDQQKQSEEIDTITVGSIDFHSEASPELFSPLAISQEYNSPVANSPVKCIEGRLEDKGLFQIYTEIENLESESSLFTDINYVLDLVEPKNNIQAVILGSLLFNKDFTKYIEPLREFRRHKMNLGVSVSDVKMNHIEKMNPMINELYLYFNPYIPRNAYKLDVMDHHLQMFSYLPSEYIGTTSYQILQELHLQENFHLGFHFNIINVETPVLLDRIDDLQNFDLVCFGVRDEVLQATSWKELKDIFQNMMMFVNPFEKKRVFTKEQIERLLRLGKWILNSNHFRFRYLFENISERTMQDIKECIETIEQIQFMQQTDFYFLTNIKHEYEVKTMKEKDLILLAFEKLFLLTMFMRGWDGKTDDLPIHHAPYPTNTPELEKKILECIFELDEINVKTKNFIYKLPLMIWKNEFVQSVLEEQGLTIGDRIKIVKNGETDGVHSCVRMTSNVFGSSYCFYCKVFKIYEKFNIKDLIYIQ